MLGEDGFNHLASELTDVKKLTIKKSKKTKSAPLKVVAGPAAKVDKKKLAKIRKKLAPMIAAKKKYYASVAKAKKKYIVPYGKVMKKYFASLAKLRKKMGAKRRQPQQASGHCVERICSVKKGRMACRAVKCGGLPFAGAKKKRIRVVHIVP